MARKPMTSEEEDRRRQLLALSAHLRRVSSDVRSSWIKEQILGYTARSLHWHWWDSTLWKEFRRVSLFADVGMPAGSLSADFQAESPLTPTSSASTVAASIPAPNGATPAPGPWPERHRLPAGLILDLDEVVAHQDTRDLDDSCLASSPPNSDDQDITSEIINIYLDLGSLTPQEGEEIFRRVMLDQVSTQDSREPADEASILLPVAFGQAGHASRTATTDVGSGHTKDQQLAQWPRNVRSTTRKSKAVAEDILVSPLQRHVEDLRAVSKIIHHEDDNETGSGEDGTENTGRNPPYPLEHLQTLEEMAEQNHVRALVSPTIEALTDLSTTSLWIREQFREKWHRQYLPSLTVRLATLALKTLELNPNIKAGTKVKKSDAQEAFEHKKQKHTKLAMTACAREQLMDVQRSLDQALVKPLRELDELQILFDAQQYLLLREHFTFSELVASFAKRQEMAKRAMTAELPFLELKLEALSTFLDVAARACSALETRIDRLSAKDAPAGEERDQVRERRLAQPEALVYLSRAAQDLQLIRDHAQAVKNGMDHVEGEMTGFEERSLELYVTCKGCFYFAGDNMGG